MRNVQTMKDNKYNVNGPGNCPIKLKNSVLYDVLNSNILNLCNMHHKE